MTYGSIYAPIYNEFVLIIRFFIELFFWLESSKKKNSLIPTHVLQTHLLPFLLPAGRLYINKETTAYASTTLRRSFVLAHYPSRILKALGGIDRCVKTYGFITGYRDMVGPTDYLDQVCLEDLPDTYYPVYFGIDCFRRPFAILQYWCQRVDKESEEDTKSTISINNPPCRVGRPDQVVVTMFQRYSLPRIFSINQMNCSTWCFGTCYSSKCMLGDTCVNDAALEKVQQLIHSEQGVVGYNQSRILGLTKETVINH